MSTTLSRLLTIRVAPDGAACGCVCGCGELAELDLRKPGAGDPELFCVGCLASALRAWVSLHDMLRGLSW